MSKPNSCKILHLVPHTGGGIGTVLQALLGQQKQYYEIQLCSLEYLNPFMKNWCQKNGVEFLESGWLHQDALSKLLKKADIIHIHWWNHPLLTALLASKSLPRMRSVIWSHVNGVHVPQVFFNTLLTFPDRFILATPQSLQSPVVKRFHNNFHQKLQIIQSNAGIPTSAPKELPLRTEFQACYIGTVDESKMHQNFIELWMKTGITDKPLVICGGPSEEKLNDKINKQNCMSNFEIRGPVRNVPEVLTNMDLFFYPLQKAHYGTGEQVLIEAMAFGVVPVVFSNGCEQFVVENGQTGIVAKSEEEFVDAVQFLYNCPDERKRLARNGMAVAQKKFNIGKTVSAWEELYVDLMYNSKREHTFVTEQFNGTRNHSPLALMLTSYGHTTERNILLKLLRGEINQKKNMGFSPVLFSNTRGAPFHYQYFFPNDDKLRRICEELSLLKNICEQVS